MNLSAIYRQISASAESAGSAFQSVLLLIVRLWWGWSFFLTGKGKLTNLDQVAGYFASLHIPLPKLNALTAGSVECFGGLLLLVGLGSRIVAIPLAFTLCVAYATAEREALFAIFSDTDKFTGATPFLFLFAVLVVFAFGPGKLSLDELIVRRRQRRSVDVATTERATTAAN